MNEIVKPSVSASEWQREVFPHSPLEALAPDLWIVRGEFPDSQLPRNMVVYCSTSHGQSLTSDIPAIVEQVARDLGPSATGRHRGSGSQLSSTST